MQQFPRETEKPAMCLVQRRVLEHELRRFGTDDALPAELIDEIRSDAPRIEELVELDVGELAELGLGVIGATLLTDARANLPHDLLDIDRVGTNGKFSHNYLSL
jgi:hypothetical protein